MRILVVDDNALNRKVTVQLLNQLGYPAQSAADGFEALGMLEGGDFEVVLMDVQMPKMNGLEVTKQIRERQPTNGSPATRIRRPIIIAITAFRIRGDEEECLEAGMDGYLEKPIQVELLKTCLKQWQKAIEALTGEPGVSINPLDPVGVEPDSNLLSNIQNRESVDWARFDELSAGHPERLASLIRSSLTEIPKQLEQLRKALDAHQEIELQTIAHDCAGVCMTFGLVKLAILLRTVEKNAKGGHLQACHQMLENVFAEYATLNKMLMRWVERHDANNDGKTERL